LQQGTNRILIELPGVTDADRVRKLLQGSAKLEFWETYNSMEIFPILENVNKILAAAQKITDTTKTVAAIKDTSTNKNSGSILASLGAKKDSTTTQDTSILGNSMAEQALQNPLFSKLSPAIPGKVNTAPNEANTPIRKNKLTINATLATQPALL